MHKPISALLRYLCISGLLVMAFLLPACDNLPSPATPTSITGTPTVQQPPGRNEPISQGWIFTLPALRQENHFNLDLDVLAPGGIPIGTISMGRGRNYEQQGNPDLMSTVAITANGKLLLEIAASNAVNRPGENSNIAVAAKGQSYEKTTIAGWHVRATVKQLAVTQHPKLADGTEAPDPVFQMLDMDVEVVGNSATPYLGLVADNVTAARAALENLRDGNLQLIDHGVIIREVTPGGPADKAGLRPGDIILAINSKKIDEYTPLTVPLSRLHVGDKVTLDVAREGRNLAIEATLGSRP